MIANLETARKLAAFANEFALPDVPRDAAEIVGTDVPDELLALIS